MLIKTETDDDVCRNLAGFSIKTGSFFIDVA